MPRLYVCPVIGTGSSDLDPQRPKIADVAGITQWWACLSTLPSGAPAKPWTLVRCDASSWTTVGKDPSLFWLTADPLDALPTARVITYLTVTNPIFTVTQMNAFLSLRATCDALVRQHAPGDSLAMFAPEL